MSLDRNVTDNLGYTQNNNFLNNIRIIIVLAHIQFIIKFDELYIQARQKLNIYKSYETYL